MSHDSDCLLYAISARGSLSWLSFKKAFFTLFSNHPSAADNVEPKILLLNCMRHLQAIGHCDFDFSSGGQVFVAPPLLCRLPRGGLVNVVLTGARSPSLIEQLTEAASIAGAKLGMSHSDDVPFGVPRRIILESPVPDIIAEIGSAVNIPFCSEPPAWQIAQYAGSVDEYLETLNWQPASEPGWQDSAFDPFKLNFSGFYDATDSLRLTRHERHGRWEYALWRNELRASSDLDWARYAVAKSRSQRILAYDVRAGILALPSRAPLPFPLSRACGLCSGLGSFRRVGPISGLDIDPSLRWCEFYSDVPRAIVEKLSEKLGPLIDASIGVEVLNA